MPRTLIMVLVAQLALLAQTHRVAPFRVVARFPLHG